MKQRLNIGKEPNFQKVIIVSAFLHVLFITLVTVPIKTKEIEYKSYFVNIVGPAEVSRSVITAPSPKTVSPKAPTRQSAAPNKGVSLEPEKSAEIVSREIDRLRAISNLSKKKKGREEALERSRESDKEIARAIEIIKKKSNERIPDRAGIQGAQVPPDVNPYLALVQRKIWDEWIHPDFNTEKLEAILSFQIDKQGNIISPKIVKSSGNALFDNSAIKAVIKSSPLPPPPVEDEFEVRFHL
ncbi:MAG: TonB family protein [Nitrospirae bacterium]|nr:TonB family protein [Nitrospirota bacterium]